MRRRGRGSTSARSSCSHRLNGTPDPIDEHDAPGAAIDGLERARAGTRCGRDPRRVERDRGAARHRGQRADRSQRHGRDRGRSSIEPRREAIVVVPAVIDTQADAVRGASRARSRGRGVGLAGRDAARGRRGRRVVRRAARRTADRGCRRDGRAISRRRRACGGRGLAAMLDDVERALPDAAAAAGSRAAVGAVARPGRAGGVCGGRDDRRATAQGSRRQSAARSIRPRRSPRSAIVSIADLCSPHWCARMLGGARQVCDRARACELRRPPAGADRSRGIGRAPRGRRRPSRSGDPDPRRSTRCSSTARGSPSSTSAWRHRAMRSSSYEAVDRLGGPLGTRWHASDRARFAALLVARGTERAERNAENAVGDLTRAQRLGADVPIVKLDRARLGRRSASSVTSTARFARRPAARWPSSRATWRSAVWIRRGGRDRVGEPRTTSAFGVWLWDAARSAKRTNNLPCGMTTLGSARSVVRRGLPSAVGMVVTRCRGRREIGCYGNGRRARASRGAATRARRARRGGGSVRARTRSRDSSRRVCAVPIAIRHPSARGVRTTRSRPLRCPHRSRVSSRPGRRGALRARARRARGRQHACTRRGRSLFDALGDPARARSMWLAASEESEESAIVAGYAEAAAARAGDGDAALVVATGAAASSGDPAVVWIDVARALLRGNRTIDASTALRSAVDLAGANTLPDALELAAEPAAWSAAPSKPSGSPHGAHSSLHPRPATPHNASSSPSSRSTRRMPRCSPPLGSRHVAIYTTSSSARRCSERSRPMILAAPPSRTNSSRSLPIAIRIARSRQCSRCARSVDFRIRLASWRLCGESPGGPNDPGTDVRFPRDQPPRRRDAKRNRIRSGFPRASFSSANSRAGLRAIARVPSVNPSTSPTSWRRSCARRGRPRDRRSPSASR